MKMRKRGELAVVVVCAVVGFLLTAQLRTVRQTAATDDTSAARLETLQKLYNESLDKNEGLEQQLTQLQNELAAYREQAVSAGSAE